MRTSAEKAPARPLVPNWVSTAVILVMIIGFGLAFWGLVQQNRELRALIDSRPSQIPDLAVGDLITPINLVAVHNAAIDFEEMISAGGVIAFLTTTCPICETSLPFWQDLSAELDGKAILFVGISLHSPNLTEQYIETHGISWPVLAAPDPTPLLRLGVTGVPLTIAIKPGGEVIGVWKGGSMHRNASAVIETTVAHLGR